MISRRIVLSVSLCASLASGCGSSFVSSSTPSAIATTPASAIASIVASPSASTSAALSTLPAEVDIESAGARRIASTPFIDWAVMVEGRPWIAGLGAGIGVLDKTGGLRKSIAVTGACESMDTGFDAVWSTSCDPAGILRISAQNAAVDRARFDMPIADSEASVGVGEGAVWVVVGASSDVLLKIDPKSLVIEHRYSIPAGGAGVRAGLGGVWITRPTADEVLRVDPASGKVVAKIAVGHGPRFLAVGEGGVWVMNQTDGSVSRIDPKTDAASATIDVGEEIHGGDIAVGGGSVWVRGGPALLARIDPAKDLVTARYGPQSGSGSVAADQEAVWVTAHDVATIWRLPLH